MPFLPLCDGVLGLLSCQFPNSSGFAGIGYLTFRVMGGKSGKKRQGCGKGMLPFCGEMEEFSPPAPLMRGGEGVMPAWGAALYETICDW